MAEIFEIIPDIFEGVFHIVEKVAEWAIDVTKLKQRLTNLALGIVDISEGIFREEFGLTMGTAIATKDILEYIIYTAIYVGELIYCTVTSLTNFPSCFIYYVIEIIGIILYLPAKFIFWICGLTSIENYIWNILYELDKKLYFATGGHKKNDQCSGWHFLHYPCWIIDKCYRCQVGGVRLADRAKYSREVQPIADDFGPDGIITELIYDPLEQIIRGAGEIADIFTA